MIESLSEPTVLVTGFGPFGSHTHNPSGVLALELDGARIGGAVVVGRQFETSTLTVGAALAATLDEVRPDLLICLGLAPGRPAISLERIAANVRDFPIADIDGTLVQDAPIVEGGADGLFTRLPIRAILAAWQAAEVPGHISDTAGTYLCNQLFYLACVAGAQRAIPAGFIHIPDTPQSSAVSTRLGAALGATMELATIRRGVELAIATSLDPSVPDALRAPTGAVA